ncbi:MAG: discoidin domain-containing protein [Bacteroidetes bacterium]|nr:discoidin domain-containing protein [Bacteroidota bacterium]
MRSVSEIFMKNLVLIFVCFFNLMAAGQMQFTPYDDLPGIYKSYKPSYTDDFPSWAKMLYQYPVNYHVISREFDLYLKQNPGEKSAVIRYFKIWRRVVEPKVLPDGTIEIPDLAGYEKNLHNARLQAGRNKERQPEGGPGWSFLGPIETFWLNESGSATAPKSCPWQANVYSFDVAASNNHVIYCGTETGFVNKTTSKGLDWQLVGQDYPFGGGITAVAIHPLDAEVVYVAAGNQIHKTHDGGLTWNPLLTAGNLFNADRLKIDPVNPQKILAASASGVYISIDGGSSWSKKWTAPAYDIEIRPGDNSRVFALTRTGGNFSVIQSTDGGETFQVQTTFPNTFAESSGGLLAMTPANPNAILALLLSAGETPYLLKGTLTGSTWNWVLKATGSTTSFPMNNGQGYFDLVLDMSPVNENIILAGTTTLYKSLNGGGTFSAVGGYAGNFNIHPDIQDIKMLPNGETWVSTDGGMNMTTDNFGVAANYFVRVNGLTGSDMWGFDQGWNEDIVVGGRYHNGNTALSGFYQPKALRMGGAESPTGWVLQGKSRHVAFNDLGNGWVLPRTAEGKPDGRFIFSKYPNMDEYGGRRSNLVHHPNYYGTLFLGEGTGFWKSTDMGVTWDLLYNFPDRVRYLQISFSNPQVFYADILGRGLCKSIDGGMTWEFKPSLTSPPYGSANWKGKIFIAISPSNENLVYACLQNGTWSADIGKVFRSSNGGDTWEDWTGSLSEYMKCIVVQPDSTGNDLMYLFTNATNGKPAKVFYRKTGMDNWASFGNNYPAGMTVNMALPFFRDSKLRVGGNGGVWESPMADTTFIPIVNPWIEKATYDCMLDTLFFDDHSILDHSGATWHWDITPQPAWIENDGIRNPMVVLGSPGSFDVSLTVTMNGRSFSKTIPGMVTASTCPSIYDCDNPAELSKNGWSLLYADSEEINDPGLATMSFDGDPSTIWHTRWSTGNDPYPHEIQVGLGGRFRISKFTYLPRQDGENGRIKNYELYISNDSLSWGAPVKTGEFVNTAAPQTIILDTATSGSYFRLVALSEVNGNPWASAAEFSLVGCVDWPVGTYPWKSDDHITAFPVPTSNIVNISLPSGNTFHYQVISSTGGIVGQGTIQNCEGSWPFHLGNNSSGIYLIKITGEHGEIFRVKVLKN